MVSAHVVSCYIFLINLFHVYLSFFFNFLELNADKLHDTFVRTHGDLAPCIKWGVSFAQDVDFDKYGMHYSLSSIAHDYRFITVLFNCR